MTYLKQKKLSFEQLQVKDEQHGIYNNKLRSYDAISSFPFSLEYYKLIMHRWDPWSCKE